MRQHVFAMLLASFLGGNNPSLIRENALDLVLPEAVFQDETLKEHLLSGLTTTFQLVCRETGKGQLAVGFRIDIRYEPWDEVFFVTLRDSRGKGESLRFESQTDLTNWWSGKRFRLVPEADLAVGEKRSFSVVLTIIPFSQQEQEKARDWLTYQNENPEGGLFEGRVGRGGNGSRTQQGNLLRIMLATSIQRDAIKRYQWKVASP